MRVGVYSALYGGYDGIKANPPEIRGVMFHDIKQLANIEHLPPHLHDAIWDFRYAPHNIVSAHGDASLVAPMLAHKYWKCHPDRALPDVDVSIWMDASISLRPGFVDRALAALGDEDWTIIKHPWRDCIYSEADYSATLARYSSLAKDIKRQAAWYKSLGHPAKWGLPATGVLVRRHTPEVLDVSHHWWDECLNWTHQDQISLPVLLKMFEGKIRFNWNLGWLEGWDLWPHLK